MREDSKQGGWLSDAERECLLSLLNGATLEEVLEERVLGDLCCNFATCNEPSMSDSLIQQRR